MNLLSTSQQAAALLRAAILCGAAVSLGAATLLEQDLASDTAWTISVADGPFRPIVVPGGSWTPDQKLPEGLPRGRAWELLPDHVVYQRSVTIPAGGSDRVTKILFGGVNHGAEVYIDDKLVTTHVGPQMPFEADITDQVKPGGTYTLKVKVYSTAHYGRSGGVPWYARGQGIVRYIRLAAYPQVNIKDVFVRTSVASRQLTYQVWIHNGGPASRSVTLDGGLASYNKGAWTYPSLLAKAVVLPPKAVTKITVGPVTWNLGQASYWWPNIPFREEYTPQLHNLNLTLKQGNTALDSYTQRFGFVEYGEGPYFYTLNGLRIGVQAAASDTEPTEGFSKAAAFLPPTGPSTGCPETWRRYLRLGINTLRTHQTTPSDYMLQAADEVGFMIIPETAIRGSDNSNTSFGPVYMPQAERELAQVSRNHPSVCRYSLHNEADGRITGGGAFIEPPGADGKAAPELTMLIDAIREADDTRPLVVESDQHAPFGRIDGANGGHAYAMLHYQEYRNWPQKQTIIGLGEYAYQEWPPTYCQLISRFEGGGNAALVRTGDLGLDMRMRDIPYFSILTVSGFWSNFLEGRTGRRDRKDGVDGWGSEEIKFIQHALDPYVIVDRAFWARDNNLCYSKNWPLTPPWYTARQTVNREIEVFNGGFAGNRMSVLWETRWDSPAGKTAASGALEPFLVEPGFHVTRTVNFPMPAGDATAKPAATPSGGKIVYTEDREYFNVDERKLYFILKSVLYDDGSRSQGPTTE
jgi:hypothetical protein